MDVINIKSSEEENLETIKKYMKQHIIKQTPIITYKPIFNSTNVCFIYSHGNSSDAGMSFNQCADIGLNTGATVICYEYPGYGECDYLKASEDGVFRHIRECYNYCTKVLQFQPEDIFLVGHSLGTGATIDLASDFKYPIGGLILHAPILSIVRTMFNVNKTYSFDMFNSIDKLDKIKAPALVIHCKEDRIVYYKDGCTLFDVLKSNPLSEFISIEKGNHNISLRSKYMDCFPNIICFIKKVSKKSNDQDLDLTDMDNKIINGILSKLSKQKEKIISVYLNQLSINDPNVENSETYIKKKDNLSTKANKVNKNKVVSDINIDLISNKSKYIDLDKIKILDSNWESFEESLASVNFIKHSIDKKVCMEEDSLVKINKKQKIKCSISHCFKSIKNKKCKIKRNRTYDREIMKRINELAIRSTKNNVGCKRRLFNSSDFENSSFYYKEKEVLNMSNIDLEEKNKLQSTSKLSSNLALIIKSNSALLTNSLNKSKLNKKFNKSF